MTQPDPEASLTSTWLSAIRTWLAPVLSAVMATSVPNPSAMWAFQRLWTREVDRIMPELISLARMGWTREARGLDVQLPWDRSDPDLQNLVARTRNLLVAMPDRVYREIIKSMAAGRNRGESQAQIAARVANILDINGSVNWPDRAKVIARTEINRFNEIGALAAGRRAVRRYGLDLVKEWDTRDDPQVRPGHAQVDGDVRRLGEPFHVGSSLLQHPVDPLGHPDDVVNCRCRLKIRRASRG